MPRGRPRKVVTEPASEAEGRVAEVLSKNCGIPGCVAKNHLEEAREIIRLTKERLT